MKLLVVEDNNLNAKLFRRLLGSEGFDVRVAVTTAEARLQLRAWRPRIVVTDLQLPGESGIELVRSIRDTGELRHLPVVVISACASLEDRRRALAAGADLFLPKPIDTRALGATLRELAG